MRESAGTRFDLRILAAISRHGRCPPFLEVHLQGNVLHLRLVSANMVQSCRYCVHYHPKIELLCAELVQGFERVVALVDQIDGQIIGFCRIRLQVE